MFSLYYLRQMAQRLVIIIATIAIDFIEKKYSSDFRIKIFDVLDEVKEKFAEYSKSYLTKGIDLKDFNLNEEKLNDRLIKLKEKNDLIL